MKNNAKLYLICPDCQMEHIIRSQYGENPYFLTALGSVFDMSEYRYAEEVNHYIDKLEISEIVIVTDIDCTFKINVICESGTFDTRAERALKKLRFGNSSLFDGLDVQNEKKLLAKLNIYQQICNLHDVAFIGNKIVDNQINISGLIYDQQDQKFSNFSYSEIEEFEYNNEFVLI